MGKTTKPISVLCIGLDETPALAQLRADGHTVEYAMPGYDIDFHDWTYDVILGPKCWRYLPDVSDKFIGRIVKEARAAQPPRVKKAKVKKGGAITS